jgi:hypothetical protein
MNILTKTIIAGGSWLALATSVDLSYGAAALAIVALAIYQVSGEVS